jgi:hypothetical protein
MQDVPLNNSKIAQDDLCIKNNKKFLANILKNQI